MMNKQLLRNGSFELGWEDVGGAMNQRPAGWEVEWVMPGQALPASSDRATIIPEVVHKGEEQLPPDEWVGGERALITDGETVFKIFGTGAFGAYLSQEVRVTEPEVEIAFDFCIETRSPDPWAAEIGVALNGEYVDWLNVEGCRALPGGRMKAYRREVRLADDRATLMIVVKAKWPVATDFFLDNVRLFGVNQQDQPNPEPPVMDWEAAYHTLAAEHAALVEQVRGVRDELGKILNGVGNENH